LHWSGDPSLKDLTWSARPWSGSSAYADSKLHDLILAFAVARKWPDVLSNAVESEWVATKIGGPGAPNDLDAGAETQVWLATSADPEAIVSGQSPEVARAGACGEGRGDLGPGDCGVRGKFPAFLTNVSQ